MNYDIIRIIEKFDKSCRIEVLTNNRALCYIYKHSIPFPVEVGDVVKFIGRGVERVRIHKVVKIKHTKKQKQRLSIMYKEFRKSFYKDDNF